MNRFRSPLLIIALAIAVIFPIASLTVSAQNPLPPGGTLVQAAPSQYSTTPISATAAVNNQTTLTIPAPQPGQYNYICSLAYSASQDGTATAQTNAVTTSTNFNSFAIKYSLTATATINYNRLYNWGTPATGCAKSTAPGTATTFVSPTAGANIAFTWDATYYQAP